MAGFRAVDIRWGLVERRCGDRAPDFPVNTAQLVYWILGATVLWPVELFVLINNVESGHFPN